MKALILTCVVLAAVCSTANDQQRRKSSTPAAKKAATLESKLATLKKCGIGFTPPYTVKDLLESYSRQELEEPGCFASKVRDHSWTQSVQGAVATWSNNRSQNR